jgi:hypothetical protein
VDLGDAVLERNALDLLRDFAILDFPFKRDELPLLKRFAGHHPCFSGALLTSLFAAGIEISQGQNSSVLTQPSYGQQIGQAVGQQVGQVGVEVTRRNLNEQGIIFEGDKRLAEKKKVRKVNREGQRWTDDRAGMTLRLPLELREAVTEEARVKGDLARIVLFALSHVNHKDVEIQQTRKAGLPLFSSIASRWS